MNFFVLFQKIVPQRLLTEVAGWLAEVTWPPLKNVLIRVFVKAYAVDMSEAVRPEIEAYPSFNAFFTRAIRSSVRPICKERRGIASPADGHISEAGIIKQDSLLQAKGIQYSATELLAGAELAASLRSGSFVTVYLSPKDYHRVHVPITAELIGVRYVPGKLFSVNDTTARSLDGLFTRNERLIAEFRTADFSYALVMVGAMIVGGMETVATGRICRGKETSILPVIKRRVFQKGEEFGRFCLGSTVILVFPEHAGVDFEKSLTPRSPIRMGEKMGDMRVG